MYIVLTNENELQITQSETIYRGDNLNKHITFLVPKTVGKVDMLTATVFMSYIRPDGTADMVILDREPQMYKQSHYQYVIPVTCKLSRYPGSVCMWLQICDGDTNNPVVSKTGECTIQIHNAKSMDDCIGDHQLTALYQLKRQCENLNNGTNGGTPDEPSDTPTDEEFDGFEVVEF